MCFHFTIYKLEKMINLNLNQTEIKVLDQINCLLYGFIQITTATMFENKKHMGNLVNAKNSLARSRDIAVKFHCKSCLLIQIKITEALAVAFYS